ncbi:hypothetical protein [Paenibacillus wynnii]|uniref:Uncharacterized protein n=1 Tax=Paenibacillus wynnii TaxID=268407 RepID=A0A098MGD2_9BACL|nr:hypothetical protein [Paenibacillus wynnii]KGE16232.1 hypothetical protein PWYN_15830 [Paenibacillus wynnii]KGE21106.1 hypothetical protein PWYN_02940 [Paenibacillus wynnii]
MEIGRRVYFDKTSGTIVQITGERSGDVEEITIEREFELYVSLSERVRDTVDVISVDYGAYAQDFIEGRLTGIDPNKKELLFSYPDPETPGEFTPPQPALSIQVTLLKAQVLAQSDRSDFMEELIAEMALMVYQ